MSDEQSVAEIAAGLSDAQLGFMHNGEEGIFGDRRVTRALCGKGLMGIAGYVFGEAVYAFTPLGLLVRNHLKDTPNVS